MVKGNKKLYTKYNEELMKFNPCTFENFNQFKELLHNIRISNDISKRSIADIIVARCRGFIDVISYDDSELKTFIEERNKMQLTVPEQFMNYNPK
jgi:hypothetical protein